MIRQSIFIPMLALMLCASCNESRQPDTSSTPIPSDTASKKRSLFDQSRLVTLPTPMQIPALLRNSDATYDPGDLLPITDNDKSYIKSGVLFGMYMIDMAYASSFSHKQASIHYFDACRNIGDDLGLGVKITQNHVDRFNRNLQKPDSLGRIILQMYDIGHKVLIDQDKEGLGFLMVLGCYMEGMNLVMEQGREHDLILFIHLLHQQKYYGNNLLSVLEQYEIPTELKTEYNHFKTVVDLLNNSNIPTVYEMKLGKKTIANMKAENLDIIAEEVKAFRTSILI